LALLALAGVSIKHLPLDPSLTVRTFSAAGDDMDGVTAFVAAAITNVEVKIVVSPHCFLR